MNLNEFSRVVDEMKVKNPVWFGLESDPKSTESDIKDIESHLLIKLPGEYKEFVKEYGGGYFAFTNVFSGDKESEWYISTQNDAIDLLNSHEFLAVSDNETGDYYGFKVINGICESKISLYDHEDNQLKSTEYKNLYDFLIKVGLNLR